jgi:3-dehydroquinate synthase
MRHMTLTGSKDTCKIMLGESLGSLGDFCDKEKTVVIADSTVWRLYGKQFSEYKTIKVNANERYKTLETVNIIYENFSSYELDRSSFIVAIGGGIVCDIAGFVASTYLRGLPFAFVPTTLLAQVDASVGGKNGVNFKGYKNLIGVFNQPQFVLCDFELLKTLPEEERRNGYAEVIKQALIGDASLFSYLETGYEKALALDNDAIEKVVHDSLSVKVRIVEEDETEQGERRKLNLGHTFGHALEKTTGLRHGEAISIGMVVAARLSHARGMLGKEDLERITAVLGNFGLPLTIRMDKEAVLDALRKDKKRADREINFVLLEAIGNARVVPIQIEDLEGVVDDLCDCS